MGLSFRWGGHVSELSFPLHLLPFDIVLVSFDLSDNERDRVTEKTTDPNTTAADQSQHKDDQEWIPGVPPSGDYSDKSIVYQ